MSVIEKNILNKNENDTVNKSSKEYKKISLKETEIYISKDINGTIVDIKRRYSNRTSKAYVLFTIYDTTKDAEQYYDVRCKNIDFSKIKIGSSFSCLLTYMILQTIVQDEENKNDTIISQNIHFDSDFINITNINGFSFTIS